MLQYNELALKILSEGQVRDDRTGTGTISLFGEKLKFDLLEGLPVITTKRVNVITAIKELLWMLSGSSSNNDLLKENVTIWLEWCNESGDLGPIYGSQWRHWKSVDNKEVDQITLLIDGLKNRPFSRRHIINSWNSAFIPNESISPQENVDLGNMCLPPCHTMAQWYVSKATDIDKRKYIKYLQETGDDLLNKSIPEYKLSCQMYQRSCDYVLGAPFNFIGYSILTMLLAKQCGYMWGDYHHIIGDVHIYLDHIDNFKNQISGELHSLPYLHISNDVASLFDYKINNFKLFNYKNNGSFVYPISV